MVKNHKKEWFYVSLLAALQFCHILDFVIVMPLGPSLMRQFSISPSEFGLLVSSYNLSSAPFTLLVGIIADRFDRKNFILVNLIGFIASTIYCGLSTSFTSLVVARVMAGAFGGVLNAGIFAVMADLIPEERRGRATGVIMSAFSIASVIGVPIGLTIATAYNWHYSFLFIGALTVIVWVLFFLFIPNLNSHIGQRVSAKDLLQHYFDVIKNRSYHMPLYLIMMVGFATFMLIPFLAPFAVKNIGILESELRYIYLVGGAFTFFSAIVIGKLCDTWGTLKTYVTVVFLSCFPILVYTNLGKSSLMMTLVFSTLFMMFVSGRFVPVVTMGSKVPKSEDRGVFMSFLNSFRSFSTALAAFIGGLLVSENAEGLMVGYQNVGFLSVFVILLSFIPARVLYKQIQSRG